MNKVIKFEQLEELSKKIKQKGEKIILVGGCFDILHTGHIKFLKSAKELGGKLLVALESDESVKRSKGEKRPVNNQKERANILSNLPSVDGLDLQGVPANYASFNVAPSSNPNVYTSPSRYTVTFNSAGLVCRQKTDGAATTSCAE